MRTDVYKGEEYDLATATMVPLLAYGPRSESLGGIHDNTDVGRALIGFVEHAR